MLPTSYPSGRRRLLVLALLLPILGAMVPLPGVATTYRPFATAMARARRPMLAATPQSLRRLQPAAPILSATGGYTVELPLVVSSGSTGAPVIASFRANPSTVAPGGASSLAWIVTGATSLSISPGLDSVSGSSVVIHPAITTEYVLTAKNGVGTATARTIVTVTGSGGDAEAFFLPSNLNGATNTSGASVAIDAAGGIHVAYTAINADNTGIYPVYYTFCAANCAAPSSWSAVNLGDHGSLGGYVQLALDPAGHPQVLWFDRVSFDQPGVYRYAVCGSQCTNSASWTLLDVAPSVGSVDQSRYFALDSQGRPRFVYRDQQTDHSGTFYAFCDAVCTDPANWFEIQLAPESLFDSALAFTHAGGLRLASALSDKILYFECDTNCTDTANWSGAALFDAGSDRAFMLRLDGQDRSRIALYQGFLGDGKQNNLLYYAWCDSACTSAASWSNRSLGLPEYYGKDVDLAFDSQNRPRMAYYVDASPYALGYAWCNTSCESASASWQSRLAETSEQLNASVPVPRQPGCTLSSWYPGLLPALVLDAAGNPRIAYDTKHLQGGVCNAHSDIRLVRFIFVGQP
jgi:hypothetical protein